MSQEIEALIKTTIQTKNIEAFNTAPEAIEKMVQAALSKEVNQNGSEPRSYSDQKMPWLDYAVGNEIRSATQECIRRYVGEHKDVLDQMVRKAIEKGDFAGPISKFFDQALTKDWNWTFEIKAEKEE